MSSWYRTGTAAFTNGNATVTGTGTAWIENASVGEGLVAPDGRIYEITAIASNTSLTISPAYLGSTASGQAYAIAPIRGRIAQLLSETSSLLASFAGVRDGIGSGLFPDGTVSLPALRFAADQDTGLRRVGANAMALVTGGVDRVLVDGSGNVAISNGVLTMFDGLPIRWGGSASSIYSGSGTSDMVVTVGSVERLRINGLTGNIGIGTSSPASRLRTH